VELLFWSIVGGIVGTVFMDIADKFMDRVNFTTGAACGGPRALGRWALGMLSGHFVHKNILESSPVKNEVSAGWIFHYVLGAGVALTYPLFYLVIERRINCFPDLRKGVFSVGCGVRVSKTGYGYTN